MKIQPDSLAGAAGLSTSRTNEAAGSFASQRYRQTEGVGSGQDSADISSLAGQIAKASAADETQSAARVSALAALYAKGQYRVDASSLSRALVSSALANPVEGAGR